MNKKKLSREFLKKCRSVESKRPKTVIEHIIKHGHISTEELKDKYGYNHPPRAARDVREQGIPLETFRVTGSDGKSIGAYRFGDQGNLRFSRQQGRTGFSKIIKEELINEYGSRCAMYLEEFNERDLQNDHRIPFEVAGDNTENDNDFHDFMLLCRSANRAKSWSCEQCKNWLETRKVEICKKCYWAYPDEYEHIAMLPIRRVDIIWSGDDVKSYELLKKKTIELHKDIPAFVKDLIIKNL